METTYRLNLQEMNAAFLNSLKALFSGEIVEITVKSVPIDRLNSDVLDKSVKSDRQNPEQTSPPTFNAFKLKTKGFKFDRDEANTR